MKLIDLDELDRQIKAMKKPTPMDVLLIITKMREAL
jgi:hypothetical protein